MIKNRENIINSRSNNQNADQSNSRSLYGHIRQYPNPNFELWLLHPRTKRMLLTRFFQIFRLPGPERSRQPNVLIIPSNYGKWSTNLENPSWGLKTLLHAGLRGIHQLYPDQPTFYREAWLFRHTSNSVVEQGQSIMFLNSGHNQALRFLGQIQHICVLSDNRIKIMIYIELGVLINFSKVHFLFDILFSHKMFSPH